MQQYFNQIKIKMSEDDSKRRKAKTALMDVTAVGKSVSALFHS